MKSEQKESAQPEQRSDAQPQRGAIDSTDDTSIVRLGWRLVKRFAALLGCVILALVMLLFVGAPLEGDMSWSASVALTGTAGWLCWMCYKVASNETEEHL